uniref:Uncharacterized protein n=1 Tax=Pararge aegeria TaxID=116150 RepID=S4NVB3_9NEOP
MPLYVLRRRFLASCHPCLSSIPCLHVFNKKGIPKEERECQYFKNNSALSDFSSVYQSSCEFNFALSVKKLN